MSAWSTRRGWRRSSRCTGDGHGTYACWHRDRSWMGCCGRRRRPVRGSGGRRSGWAEVWRLGELDLGFGGAAAPFGVECLEHRGLVEEGSGQCDHVLTEFVLLVGPLGDLLGELPVLFGPVGHPLDELLLLVEQSLQRVRDRRADIEELFGV